MPKNPPYAIWIILALVLLGIWYLTTTQNGYGECIEPEDLLTFIGELSNGVEIFYQDMTTGFVVRLELGSSTTWVGVYDCESFGETNADTALRIGWVDEITYPEMVSLLASNPLCDCFD